MLDQQRHKKDSFTGLKRMALKPMALNADAE